MTFPDDGILAAQTEEPGAPAGADQSAADDGPTSATEVGDVSGGSTAVGSVGGSQNTIDQSRRGVDLGLSSWQVRGHTFVAESIHVGTLPDHVRATEGQTRRSRRDQDALRRGVPAFVPPEGLPEMVDTLLARRMVVLTARPGGGAHAAASYLVTNLAERLVTDKIELAVDEVLVESDFELAEQLDQKHQALVVDLVDGSDHDVDKVFRSLGKFQHLLADHLGFLVLAIHIDQHQRFADEFPGRVRRLERPDWRAVFRAQLAGTAAAGWTDELLGNGWLREQAADAWPPRVARLARFLIDAHQNGNRQLDDALTYAQGLDEDWSGALRKLMAEHQDGQWRSLLIAAAGLEGAGPMAVTSGAELLMDCANFQPPAVHALERPGVVSRLEPLTGIDLDLSSTVFGRTHFGSSVLEHVWTEHYDLRPALCEWFAQVPLGAVAGLDQLDVERFADRFTDLLDHHDGRSLVDVTNAWITSPKLSRLLESLAVRVLGRASVKDGIGRQVRDQLYVWSRARGDQGRQVVVAKVCGGELGQRFPRNALVRLKHLAGNDVDGVTSAVVDAVTSIAYGRSVPTVLGYLAGWVDQAPPLRLTVLRAALRTVLATDEQADWLATAAPARETTRLVDRVREASSVVEFWRRALADDVSSADSAELVRAWLDATAAVVDPLRREMLVELLVDAVAGDLWRIGVLYHTVRRWSGGATSVALTGDDRIDHIRAHLLTRLDETDPLLSPQPGGSHDDLVAADDDH